MLLKFFFFNNHLETPALGCTGEQRLPMAVLNEPQGALGWTG